MQESKDIARYALDYAMRRGATAVRVSYGSGRESSCMVRDNDIDNIFSSSSSSLVVMLHCDGRYGEFSSNLLERCQIEELIDRGLSAIRLIAPDPCRVLPPSELCFKGPCTDLGQYDSTFEEVTPLQRREMAAACAAEAFGSDKRLISIEAEYGDALYYNYMIDSQGFEGEDKQTSFVLNASCTVKGKGDRRPEGFWYESALHLKDLKLSGCGATALRRALDSLDARAIPSGEYNIVIENAVASKVVSPLLTALNGSALQQKNSFLLDSLGKKIFAEEVTLIDDPHLYGAMGARWFGSDGLATKRRTIIDKGVVNTYFISTYYGRKMNLEPTVEGVSVPLFVPTSEGLGKEGVLKLAGRGIFITGFNGGNQNGATGDYSYGIQGFYFEDGKLLFPVCELNITGNLVDLWNNVIAIGDDPLGTSRWLIPTLAFSNVAVSGE